MADYTTPENVLDELPDDVSAAIQAKIPGWITGASAQVDAGLPGYPAFQAITDTPATPSLIEEITRLLVVDRVIRKLGLIRRSGEEEAVETYRAQADRMLRQLADGERVIPLDQMP